MVFNAECPFCHMESETVEHAILFCDWTRMFWLGLQIQCIPRREGVTSIYQWMGDRFKEFRGVVDFKEFNEISLSCGLWSVWKERCQATYEGRKLNPWATLNRANLIINDYWNHWKQLLPGARHQRHMVHVYEVWRPPPRGFLKANIDATFNREKNSAQAGIIF